MKPCSFVSIRRSRSAIGHLSVRSPGRAIRPTPTRIWSTRNYGLSSGIRSTLDKQPRRRQQIFRMHRMEGKKYAEIALSLSLSVKTVEAEMTKVLRTLRNEIDNYIRTQ